MIAPESFLIAGRRMVRPVRSEAYAHLLIFVVRSQVDVTQLVLQTIFAIESIISCSRTAVPRPSTRNAIYPKKFAPALLVYDAVAVLRFWVPCDIARPE